MFSRFLTCIKHRWLDASDCRQKLPTDMLMRLKGRVAASEHRHTGEIRICIETGLPTSYLWRYFWRNTPMQTVMRERAVMMFSKLHLWDTAQNNGVLIYLLLAERSIELVADRGINQHVGQAQWNIIVKRLSKALHEDKFEDGLTQALEEVSAIQMKHFELKQGEKNPNELPDVPFVV